MSATLTYISEGLSDNVYAEGEHLDQVAATQLDQLEAEFRLK